MGNISFTAGKELLDLLAEDSDQADQFRRFVLGQSTTYFGESDDWCVSSSDDWCVSSPVAVPHTLQNSTPRHGDWIQCGNAKHNVSSQPTNTTPRGVVCSVAVAACQS